MTPVHCQLEVRFSYPDIGSQGGFHCIDSDVLENYSPLYLPVCLSSHRDFSCVLHFLWNPRRVVYFFSLFSFSLGIRMQWQFPNFLYMESEAFKATKYGRSSFIGLLVFTIIFSILELDLLNINDIHNYS